MKVIFKFLVLSSIAFTMTISDDIIGGEDFKTISKSIESSLVGKNKEDKKYIKEFLMEIRNIFYTMYIRDNKDRISTSKSYSDNLDFFIKDMMVNFLKNKTLEEAIRYLEYYKITKEEKVFTIQNSIYNKHFLLKGNNWDEISSRILVSSKDMNFIDKKIYEINLKNIIQISEANGIENNTSTEEEVVLYFKEMTVEKLLNLEVENNEK